MMWLHLELTTIHSLRIYKAEMNWNPYIIRISRMIHGSIMLFRSIAWIISTVMNSRQEGRHKIMELDWGKFWSFQPQLLTIASQEYKRHSIFLANRIKKKTFKCSFILVDAFESNICSDRNGIVTSCPFLEIMTNRRRDQPSDRPDQPSSDQSTNRQT